MHINALKLYRNAVTMAQTVEGGTRTPGQVNALTSLIFAALSLETFINEIPTMAALAVESDVGNAPLLQMFSDVMAELEQDKASIQAKYLAGKMLISGKPFDKGKAPYQDFRNLVKLRDQIVHQKSFEEIRIDDVGNVTIEKRKGLEPFRSKGLLAEFPPLPGFDPEKILTNWLDDISTKAMAIWACNTASQMVNVFLDGIPIGVFRTKTEAAYRAAFQPI